MKGKQLLLDFIKAHIWSYIVGITILLFSSFVAMTIPKTLGTITDGLDKRNMATASGEQIPNLGEKGKASSGTQKIP